MPSRKTGSLISTTFPGIFDRIVRTGSTRGEGQGVNLIAGTV